MKLWIARDESGDLALYYLKPELNDLDVLAFYQPQKFGVEYPICNDLFPEVTFENSPQQVELKLVEK
jgi:hypothetical protein